MPFQSVQVHSAQAGQEAEGQWIAQALHDLCQPLTALECRLVLSTMEVERCATDAETAVVLRNGIDEALTQCARTVMQVRSMQERLMR